LDGVYPVLLYRRDNASLSTAYGVSASAQKVAGDWPRVWPDSVVSGLKKFPVKKYGDSYVSHVVQTFDPSTIDEITAQFVKIIDDFLSLRNDLPLNAALDNNFFIQFGESLFDANLSFTSGAIERFAVALLSKRFCVLTGLAGSGKTKLAEAFAMWLCESPKQYQVVAVGADWTSNENLLGYADALQAGVYRMPANGALDLMLRAAADPAKPYFLILDEMNLSHVERYFADVLSAIESGNAHIALHGHAGLLPTESGGTARVPSSIPLPANLFIIGTVNVDETTYMFSPKVLDRANVIEFRATVSQMGAFLDDPARVELAALEGQGAANAGAFVQRSIAPAPLDALVDADGGKVADKLKAALLDAFAALSDIGAEFGFRSANEIARFVAIHKELSGEGWKFSDALDAQVLQKLMPKLHGSARKLDGVLKALDAFAEAQGLPLTREKIGRMQKRLERDGFTSFAEN
jgi:5-methylcytosine-specific restriction protein B